MEFHFDFGVDGITVEQANVLLGTTTDTVKDMGGFMGGGFSEYTWVDTATHRLGIFLYRWRNRINRLLGRNPWHTGRVVIGDAVYAPPEGENHEG